MYPLLYLVPKNYLSAVIGRLARIERPRALVQQAIKCYAKFLNVNVDEASRDLRDYRSVSEFFVRELNSDVRPVGEGVVCPVDGVVTEAGELNGDKLIQVKKKWYSLRRLLGNSEYSARFCDGFYLTFYLSPADYHGIHSPVDGEIVGSTLIEGKLWPVNSWALNNIDELFSRNERIITYIESAAGLVAVVKVGATNVGCISLSYDDFQGNVSASVFGKRTGIYHRKYDQAKSVAKGEKIGVFNLGSSVVMIFEKGKFFPGTQCVRGPVKMGCQLSA